MIAIFSLKKTLVKWPTGEAKQNIHEGFKNIGEMEDVIGAIDGSHIVLANAPLKQPETYWNRKKKYSIQLQGIVDYRGEEYLLGDSAYLISTFLIKPFVNSQNPSQIQFNVIHSLHKVVVENAFERLKNRFITLKELNVKDISTVVKITECAIILHNFLELNNDNVEELYENDDDEDGDDDSDNDKDIN
ncbi:hypothetical protein RirG_154910 [Rhizophagus irregularis DAOM 197198w]|uniref:DDE Tnp4 domain-containing protein n=1 Tax=Rhizophagus irregularis (strain DAOM 197198w) TaxID=1432141 RepID=A0A015K6R0_RHIIW|nr:hypothetical protein RirG_154910 [Rhizophagus irregularis DAOM 197198w]